MSTGDESSSLSIFLSLYLSLSLFLSWASSDTKREVKSAGTTRLIEMRITRKKNGTESGGMIGRHAMCPFDRSLHSLFASPSSPARKELRKGKREKERERERERERGWIACQHRVYSEAACTLRTRSTVLDTSGVSRSRIKVGAASWKILIMHPSHVGALRDSLTFPGRAPEARCRRMIAIGSPRSPSMTID